MRKGRFAEWLVEQVTTRERASSTVGDLLESAGTSGEVRFWSSVLRTVGSFLWRGIANDPLGILGLAFRGLLVNVLLSILFLMGTVVLLVLFGVTLALLSGRSGNSGIDPRLLAGEASMARGVGFALWTLTQFQVGRWVARRAPHRELSACLATIVLPLLIAELVCVAVTLLTGDPNWRPDLNSFNLFLPLAPCMLGGMWVRRHQKA